jgi:hypothetical protein
VVNVHVPTMLSPYRAQIGFPRWEWSPSTELSEGAGQSLEELDVSLFERPRFAVLDVEGRSTSSRLSR